jgi:hypothetical protein
MSGVSYGSIFHYREYRDDMKPFVEQALQGNCSGLIAQTTKLVNAHRQTWPLAFHDESPPALERLENADNDSGLGISYLFVWALSGYLDARHQLSFPDMFSLKASIADEDALLLEGLPTYKLLRPDLQLQGTEWPIRDLSHFWLLLHTDYARCVWYDTELISKLLLRKASIGEYDMDRLISKTPYHYWDNTVVVRSFTTSLKLTFERMFTLFETAASMNAGVFMSTNL